MTPAERKSFAEQLVANPLTEELLDRIETDAIEALVHARAEQERVEAQWRVRAAREFRRSVKNYANASTGINPKGVA